MQQVQRHTWLNTIIGILDTAFQMTDEELYFTNEIVRELLIALRIPERGVPAQLPVPVGFEAESGMYAIQITESRDAGVPRMPRLATHKDVTVSLEAWRQAIVTLLTIAYPDLDPVEVAVATRIVDEMLVALGLPGRVAYYLPEDVVRAHLQGA